MEYVYMLAKSDDVHFILAHINKELDMLRIVLNYERADLKPKEYYDGAIEALLEIKSYIMEEIIR